MISGPCPSCRRILEGSVVVVVAAMVLVMGLVLPAPAVRGAGRAGAGPAQRAMEAAAS